MLKIFYTDKFTCSNNFLLYILNNYFDKKSEKEIEIIKNKHGKPYFKNCSLYFNISHTANVIIIVISDTEAGIDIEKKSRIITEKFADKYFKDEYANLAEVVKLWTIKESIIKYLGKSVLTALKFIKINNNNFLYNNKNLNVNIFSFELYDYYISVTSKNKDYELIIVEDM